MRRRKLTFLADAVLARRFEVLATVRGQTVTEALCGLMALEIEVAPERPAVLTLVPDGEEEGDNGKGRVRRSGESTSGSRPGGL